MNPIDTRPSGEGDVPPLHRRHSRRRRSRLRRRPPVLPPRREYSGHLRGQTEEGNLTLPSLPSSVP